MSICETYSLFILTLYVLCINIQRTHFLCSLVEFLYSNIKWSWSWSIFSGYGLNWSHKKVHQVENWVLISCILKEVIYSVLCVIYHGSHVYIVHLVSHCSLAGTKPQAGHTWKIVFYSYMGLYKLFGMKRWYENSKKILKEKWRNNWNWN